MNENKEKESYRKLAKEVRKTLDLKGISTVIENKIRDLPEYKNAKNIMSYLAKDIEISLDNLFDDKLKSWFLPVVGALHGAPLLVVQYLPGKTKLIKNNFDILEPEIIDENYFDQTTKKINLDLIFVPGLCFDKSGNRIGFGKGFYDKFLKLNKNSFKIGCCPKECLVEKLPIDIWDEKVDLFVTT